MWFNIVSHSINCSWSLVILIYRNPIKQRHQTEPKQTQRIEERIERINSKWQKWNVLHSRECNFQCISIATLLSTFSTSRHVNWCIGSCIAINNGSIAKRKSKITHLNNLRYDLWSADVRVRWSSLANLFLTDFNFQLLAIFYVMCLRRLSIHMNN